MVNPFKSASSKSSHPRSVRPSRPSQPTSQRNETRLELDDDATRSRKRTKLSSDHPKLSLTRTNDSSVGRDLAPRPPTKLTIAEPGGDILQTTNGVQSTLDRYFQGGILQGGSATKDGLVARDGGASRRSRTPVGEAKSQDKRTLRSQDEGGRLKSELAIYFPNYEDVIHDTPKDPELLDLDTVIHLRDDPIARATMEPPPTTPVKPSKVPTGSARSSLKTLYNVLSSSAQTSASPTAKFNGAQVLDYSTIEKSMPHDPQDPLTDAVYFKPHRRAERKEKQLRNIEKERAMHEKVQLERLLDGLRGHDWLKVLGITGVTDSEAKRFEPKRDYFVAEVQSLVRKFKQWKEEEKRLRMEKETALITKEQEVGGGDETMLDEDQGSESEPDSSEIDASAARQLQVEASGGLKSNKTRPRTPLAPPPVIYRPPSPVGPFTSFYDKPHLRTAALGKQRHGRNVTAFGLPVPELPEQEFSLPPDYTTPDALKESARRRRRMKRESLVDSAK